jgi:hypothetical protein
MFKTKLFVAIAALGMSAAASADIGGSTASGEFVFSAFDANSGVGYTYELQDLGFDAAFARGAAGTTTEGVRMNSLIGTTHSTSALGSSLIASGAGGIVFDYALPSFGDFLAGANAAGVKWNVTSIDVSGLRRVIQTVAAAPTATSPYSNTALIESVSKLSCILRRGERQAPRCRRWFRADRRQPTAYGFCRQPRHQLRYRCAGYNSLGGLDQSLAVFVFSSTTTTSSTAKGLFGQMTDGGNAVMAKVYAANDGMYHLQISAVPEPSTYAMLLAGLGLLGFAARRARG